MLTERGVLVPFPGRIAIQPGAGKVQSFGALILLLWLGLLVGAEFILARRVHSRLVSAHSASQRIDGIAVK